MMCEVVVWSQVATSCGHSNGPLGLVKGKKFCIKLSNCYLLKESGNMYIVKITFFRSIEFWLKPDSMEYFILMLNIFMRRYFMNINRSGSVKGVVFCSVLCQSVTTSGVLFFYL
jgi:hypothetical protein